MPKKKLKWTHLAIADLINITKSISQNNPPAAYSMLKSIKEEVERLEDFPKSGRMVPEFQIPTLREVIVPPYRIVYRLTGSDIHILRVYHSRQDIGADQPS